MRNLNRCEFIGNIGRDPEFAIGKNETPICRFSIAVNDDNKNSQHTEWVRAVAFGRLAEIVNEYLSKGSKVYIAGRMKTQKWQDNQGIDRYTTEIMLSDLEMLGGKADTGLSPRSVPQPTSDNFADEDLPF